MKPTTFHPDADAEVTEAAEYYESRSLGLGSELLGEVEKALGQISTNPEACQRIGRRARLKDTEEQEGPTSRSTGPR